MAHQARTQPARAIGAAASPIGRTPADLAAADLAAADLATAIDEAPLLDLDGALDRLWHLLTSMRVALVLILALAGLAITGTLLVQAPPGVLADPAARADWLNQVRPKYGGWTGVFDTLGLFAVFESLWFRLIAAGLTVSVIACSIRRIPGMWKMAMNPHVGVGAAFFEHAPQREAVVVRGTPDAALANVEGIFRRRRYRTLVERGDTAAGDGATHILYADRFRWVPFAGLMGHLALVVIVVGALVGATFGFRDPDFVIAEGSTAAVPGSDGLTVELVSFKDSYYASTGAPSDYASDLVLYRDGQEVARQTVRVNDPLRYEGTSFYQSFYGPAARVSVADESGTELFAGGIPLAWSVADDNRRVGSFTLPDRDLTVWVVGTGGSDDLVVRPGQMRVEVYRNDSDATPVDAISLDPGKPAVIDGLSFTFERELQFSGLSIARDPGTPIVWLGCALLFIGFVIRFTVPHRRIWVQIGRQGGHSRVSLASVGRGDAGIGSEYARLIEDIVDGGKAASPTGGGRAAASHRHVSHT
jgi:cytochrome c biogenesis protein